MSGPEDDRVTFDLLDETWTLLRDSDRWRVGEVRTVERWMQRRDIQHLTLSEQVAAAVWVTVHRERPTFTPADVDALDYGELAGIFDQLAAVFDRAVARARAAGAPVPPPADVEPGPSTSADSTA